MALAVRARRGFDLASPPAGAYLSAVADADSTRASAATGAGNPRFAPTRWTIVCAAGESPSSPQAARALEELCRLYWYPLYAYVRRAGHDAHTAQDLTQEFFARLLAKQFLRDIDPAQGRFRSFLLACLKHFLAHEWDRAAALKRGGGRAPLSLDTREGETRYQRAPADTLTPDKLFDRQWALTLLDQVLTRLQAEYAADDQSRLFDALRPFLTVGKGAVAHAEVAAALGVTETAAKVAVHRLRKRYRALLRDEIAQTVADPTQVDEELRTLFTAFQS